MKNQEVYCGKCKFYIPISHVDDRCTEPSNVTYDYKGNRNYIREPKAINNKKNCKKFKPSFIESPFEYIIDLLPTGINISIKTVK